VPHFAPLHGWFPGLCWRMSEPFDDKAARKALVTSVRQVPALGEGERARLWKLALERYASDDDCEFGLWKGELDEANQRVIKQDCERTRSGLATFRDPQRRELLERMLTCYCKVHRIRYKQGLNEVLAPFLHLLGPPSFTVDDAFFCLQRFIRAFLPSVFKDDDFVGLQSFFHQFSYLLMYHAPASAQRLEASDVPPDLYATPWFLTLFASKTELELLLMFWDLYIAEGDAFFFAYFGLALMQSQPDAVRRSERHSLPEALSKLAIESADQLIAVWRQALVIRAATPVSFAGRMVAALSASGNEALRELEDQKFFSISPSEVVTLCFQPRQDPPGPGPEHLLLHVLDVRTVYDFQVGHLPNSSHFDYNRPDLWHDLCLVLGSDVKWTHLVIMSKEGGAGAVALYNTLVKQHNWRYLSVLEGGFAAVQLEVQRRGFSLPSSLGTTTEASGHSWLNVRPDAAPPPVCEMAPTASLLYDCEASTPLCDLDSGSPVSMCARQRAQPAATDPDACPPRVEGPALGCSPLSAHAAAAGAGKSPAAAEARVSLRLADDARWLEANDSDGDSATESMDDAAQAQILRLVQAG